MQVVANLSHRFKECAFVNTYWAAFELFELSVISTVWSKVSTLCKL